MTGQRSESTDAPAEASDSLRARWDRALEESRLLGGGEVWSEDAQKTVATAVENAAVSSGFRFVDRVLTPVERTLARCVRGSRIVGWFLAEPDPEVVVIDLRETYTVGPVIRVLAWTGDRAVRGANRTGIADAWARFVGSVGAEPLRFLGVALVAVALGGLVGAAVSGGSLGGWLVMFGAGLLATRERRSAGELAETRLGRALVTAFEPPEPPER